MELLLIIPIFLCALLNENRARKRAADHAEFIYGK